MRSAGFSKKESFVCPGDVKRVALTADAPHQEKQNP